MLSRDQRETQRTQNGISPGDVCGLELKLLKHRKRSGYFIISIDDRDEFTYHVNEAMKVGATLVGGPWIQPADRGVQTEYCQAVLYPDTPYEERVHLAGHPKI